MCVIFTHRDGGPCTILHVQLRGIDAVEVGERGLDVSRVGVAFVVVAGRGGRGRDGGGGSELLGGSYNRLREERRGGSLLPVAYGGRGAGGDGQGGGQAGVRPCAGVAGDA